jgi:hypothetical protein
MKMGSANKTAANTGHTGSADRDVNTSNRK